MRKIRKIPNKIINEVVVKIIFVLTDFFCAKKYLTLKKIIIRMTNLKTDNINNTH